ncbi:kinase-like domain-containing protein [Cerioporus squamosus]|nr:kinase-like domain-containing protein [Cerioporus squamosus]
MCLFILTDKWVTGGFGHRAIPGVYAWGRSQFYEYLALELLDEDLSDMKGKLTMRNLVAIAMDGLEHVHSRGIVHCDLKPPYFMLGREGRLHLIDFGICWPYRIRDTGRTVEAHISTAPSRRDDIESLSYTLLALIAGGLPWEERDGDSRLSTQRQRVTAFSRKKQWTGARLAGQQM